MLALFMHAGMKVHNTRCACNTCVIRERLSLRQEGVGVVVFEDFLLLLFFFIVVVVFISKYVKSLSPHFL